MPMFSGYVGPGVARYRFRFMADPAARGAAPIEITSRDLGFDESRFMRFFFYNVYHSSRAATPQLRYDRDDRHELEARMTPFFEGLVRHWREQSTGRPELLDVRVVIEEIAPRHDSHEVGRYDVAQRRYSHLWGSPP
jgi:hypothetical protein